MKALKMILIISFFLLSGEWIAAQPRGRFPQVRERVSNVKLNQIAKRMGIEKERVEQLRPMYLEFEREKHKIMDVRSVNETQIAPDSLTDELSKQVFFMQLNKAKRIIELREKYFMEFQIGRAHV